MNEPKPELLDDRTIVVSPSQLELMGECRQHWAFKHIWRRERNAPAAARDGGKAFDAAINLRYIQQRERAVVAGGPLELDMCDAVDASFAGIDLPLEEYRTAARYKEVVRAYNAYWQDEPFRVLAVQMPIAARLGEVRVGEAFWKRYGGAPCGTVGVVIHGILDMLIEWDGQALVLDTKTMNDWGPRKQVEWENAGQPMAYAWAVQQVAAQHPELGLPTTVHGFALNAVVIRKPTTSARATLPREEFHRLRVNYTPERLEKWRRDALAEVEWTLAQYARGEWVMNRKACANHYGRPCPFLEVCTLPKEQREIALMSDLYRVYEKGPLAAISGEDAG